MKKFFSLLSIPLGLALMFGLTSASWNNDNFIDDSFWSQNPSDEEIIDALFNESVYTENWTNSNACENEDIQISRVSTLPNGFSMMENTIYVLETESVVITHPITTANCSALISEGRTTIFMNSKFGDDVDNKDSAIKNVENNNVIFSNLKLDGLDNGNGGTHDKIYYPIYLSDVNSVTFDNIEIYNFKGDVHLLRDEYITLNNIEIHDNGYNGNHDGIKLQNTNNSLFSQLVFNDAGISTTQSSDNRFDNIAVSTYGITVSQGGNNMFLNVESSNTNGIGLSIATSTNNIFENLDIHDNEHGIYLHTNVSQNPDQWIRTVGNIFRNVKVYNNQTGFKIADNANTSINNILIFNNQYGLYIGGVENGGVSVYKDNCFHYGNAINNGQIFNNEYGVYMQNSKNTNNCTNGLSDWGNLLNNVLIYNNTKGYYSTMPNTKFNNVSIYNNSYGVDYKNDYPSTNPRYYGVLELFENNETENPQMGYSTPVFNQGMIINDKIMSWNYVINFQNKSSFLLDRSLNYQGIRGKTANMSIEKYSYGKDLGHQKQPYHYVDGDIEEWGSSYNPSAIIGTDISTLFNGITYVDTSTAVVLSDDNNVTNYSIYGSDSPLVNKEIGKFGQRKSSENVISVIWGDLPYATHYTEYSVDIDAPTIEITQPSTEWARTKTVSAIASDTNPTNQTVTMYYSITTSTECNSAEAEYTLGDDILFESEDDNGKYVCFKAIDIVGNESYLVSNVIEKIDRTPPSLESKVLDETIWYTGDQQEIFTFIDTGVSLISGESTRTCTVIGEGRGLTCAITPNICDILGNCTANQEFISNSIKIDRTAPVAKISYTGYACGHGNILITVTGYDVLSGMPDEPYSFDIAGNWSTTNTKVVYTGTSGLIYIIDIAGNYSGTEYNVDWQELSPTLSNPIYNYGTKIRTYESFDLGNMIEKLGADGGICRGEQLSVVAESVSCSSGEYSLENNVLTVKPPKGSYGTVTCTITFKNDTNDIVEGTVTYDYNTYNELLLTLKPGWNVVSTPAVLSSLEFGNGGENISFSKMESGSWVSVPAITGNIIPLDGYVVNNANDDDVSMLFVYDTGVSVGNTMRQKNVDLGWNFLGITTLITPFNNIPGAVMSLDFTSYGITNLKNGVMNGGTYNLNSQSSSISNPELGEAYGVFVNQSNGIYGGANNRRTYTNN